MSASNLQRRAKKGQNEKIESRKSKNSVRDAFPERIKSQMSIHRRQCRGCRKRRKVFKACEAIKFVSAVIAAGESPRRDNRADTGESQALSESGWRSWSVSYPMEVGDLPVNIARKAHGFRSLPGFGVFLCARVMNEYYHEMNRSLRNLVKRIRPN